jgi:hypothetical protein
MEIRSVALENRGDGIKETISRSQKRPVRNGEVLPRETRIKNSLNEPSLQFPSWIHGFQIHLIEFPPFLFPD